MNLAEVVGSSGVGILLVAFLLNLTGVLPRTSRTYHALNCAGAGVAIVGGAEN